MKKQAQTADLSLPWLRIDAWYLQGASGISEVDIMSFAIDAYLRRRLRPSLLVTGI